MKVIYIMADSLRRDHVGAYGHPPWGPIYTPNLDKFAEKAAIFDNAYIGSFPTVPNRRDTHLGHGDKNLPFNRWRQVDADEVMFPKLLSEKGVPSMLITDTMNNVTGGRNIQRDYTSWAFNRGQEGENCWLDDTVELEWPVPRHMIRYDDARWLQTLVNRAYREKETDWFAPGTYSMALDWLEKNYTRDDFFLWIDTFDPHEPWDPPQYYVEKYDRGYKGRVFDAPSYGIRKEMGITDRELKHTRALYAGEVTMVDTWFGHLMAKLEILGIADETVVIFTSDHGTNFDGPGDVGFIQKIPAADSDGFLVAPGRKRKLPMRHFPLSQNVARVPLMIRWPGLKKQKRIKAIVQPWDMTPTILNCFKAPVPKRMIGKSLLPLIKGTGKPHRRAAVLGLCNRNPGNDSGWVQAMDGTWSYTAWRGERGPALHHMTKDRNCRRNLVKKHPAVARRLEKEIRSFMAAQDLDPEWVERYGFANP